MTVIKTRLEGGVAYANVLSGLAHVARTERLAGLFTGVWPTVLRDAPYSGLYLMLYETLRPRVAAALPEGGGGPTAVNFYSAALAGAAATMLTMPPDVVRTRMQLAGSSALAGAAAREGPAEAMRAIVRDLGVGGLWTGATPRLLRRTAMMALTWTMYEESVVALGGSPRVDLAKKAI